MFYFWGSNWQYVITGSGYGMAPNRRQVIAEIIDDPAHWRILRQPASVNYGVPELFCSLTPVQYWHIVHYFNVKETKPVRLYQTYVSYSRGNT